MIEDGPRDLIGQVVFLQHGQGVGKRGWVGSGWPRGNDIQPVTHNIRQHQCDQRGWQHQAR